MTIEAENPINYDIKTNIATAVGKVRLTQEKNIITADQLTYYGNESLIKAVGSVKVFSKDGEVIEADRLVYNRLTDIADFNDHVKLTSKDVTITAAQLTYYNNSGLVIASGEVKIIRKQDVYQTGAIEYNLNSQKGSSGAVDCWLDGGGDRGTKLMGKSMEIANDVTKVNRAVFTRCLEPTPEYFITVTKVEYNGKRIKSWNSIVHLYGIPVFYFPYLSFQVDSEWSNHLEPGYDEDDGFYLEYSFTTPIENGRNWLFNGVYKTKNTSTYGIGLGVYKGKVNNQIAVKYNTPIYDENYWNIANTVSWTMPLFHLRINGSRDFNTSEKTQYEFNLTPKYWDSPLGRWQAGILAHKITALSGLNKYGGVYAGCRLDYKPHQYMTFSLFRVEPLSTLPGGDFQSLLSDYDYRFGTNWLYNIGAPLRKNYSFNLNGSYNSTQELWIARDFRITKRTCCYKLSLGWNDLTKSITFDWSIYF